MPTAKAGAWLSLDLAQRFFHPLTIDIAFALVFHEALEVLADFVHVAPWLVDLSEEIVSPYALDGPQHAFGGTLGDTFETGRCLLFITRLKIVWCEWIPYANVRV